MNRFEVKGDQRTVWVNEGSGGLIGRFSRFGVDVHRPADITLATGVTCDHCTHGVPGVSDWDVFVELMVDRGVNRAELIAVRPAFLS